MDSVDDEKIESVCAYLRKTHREGHLGVAIRCGAHVVNELLGGDLERWRKQGRRENSVRRLARHMRGGGSMSVGELYRCLSLYELDRRLSLLTHDHLTLSHAIPLLGLPHDEQVRLIAEAKAAGWSSRVMAREAKGVRGGGVLPLPATRRIERALDELRAHGARGPRERAEARAQLEALRARLDAALALVA